MKNFQKRIISFLLEKYFGSLYKSLIKLIRHKFSINSTNLDKIENKNLSTLALDKLFIHFNCDKGSYCFFDKEK